MTWQNPVVSTGGLARNSPSRPGLRRLPCSKTPWRSADRAGLWRRQRIVEAVIDANERRKAEMSDRIVAALGVRSRTGQSPSSTRLSNRTPTTCARLPASRSCRPAAGRCPHPGVRSRGHGRSPEAPSTLTSRAASAYSALEEADGAPVVLTEWNWFAASISCGCARRCGAMSSSTYEMSTSPTKWPQPDFAIKAWVARFEQRGRRRLREPGLAASARCAGLEVLRFGCPSPRIARRRCSIERTYFQSRAE